MICLNTHRGTAPPIRNLGTGRGGRSAPRPGRFNPGKDTVPILKEAGWASGPVWTGARNLASTGIRSPDRPARSESLSRPPVQQVPHQNSNITLNFTKDIPLCCRSLHEDSLRTGQSGDRIPVGTRFSAPVQTGPGGPPSSLYNEYWIIPGDNAAEAWR